MDQPTDALFVADPHRVPEAVLSIIKEARDSAETEQRRSPRVPFFRPVMLALNDGESPRFSAFCRDISLYGIGLLHIMPIECRVIVVRFTCPEDQPIDLRVRIDWCQDCGEGWYMSGGRLLDVE